jgi:hypothetical protein
MGARGYEMKKIDATFRTGMSGKDRAASLSCSGGAGKNGKEPAQGLVAVRVRDGSYFARLSMPVEDAMRFAEEIQRACAEARDAAISLDEGRDFFAEEER